MYGFMLFRITLPSFNEHIRPFSFIRELYGNMLIPDNPFLPCEKEGMVGELGLR